MLSIVFHWFIYLSLCQYHNILITLAVYYICKLGSVRPPNLFFFFTTILAIQGPLRLHMNYRMAFLFKQKLSLGCS